MKSYCYNIHELPFIISNLDEGYEYLDKLVLYEYNYTHTGIPKNYELENVLHFIPERLREKLIYKKVDLTDYIEYAYENVQGNRKIHYNNEPIQRSWFFNDTEFDLRDDTIIIDNDIDEIIYRDSYPKIIREMLTKNHPLSIRLNQFFFKHTYLWKNLNFKSPSIYTYAMVKNISRTIKGLSIKNLRDLPQTTSDVHGCHMSWVMPVSFMITKLHSYSHPEYRKFANEEVLSKAVKEKKYIFDVNRPFEIEELDLNDPRIPKVLQCKELYIPQLEAS